MQSSLDVGSIRRKVRLCYSIAGRQCHGLHHAFTSESSTGLVAWRAAKAGPGGSRWVNAGEYAVDFYRQRDRTTLSI